MASAAMRTKRETPRAQGLLDGVVSRAIRGDNSYHAVVNPVLSLVLGAGLVVAHLAAIVGVLVSEKRQPAATLAWLFALFLLPGFGLFAWFVIGKTGSRRISRDYRAASRRVAELMERRGIPPALLASVETAIGSAEPCLSDTAEAGEPAEPAATPVRVELAGDDGVTSMLRLGDRLATTPASTGNRVAMLVDGAATYASIRDAILAARDHVHVEFYIFRGDDAGRELRDLLAAKAREGIAVRVLCDAVGSLVLDDSFWDPLREAGGHAAFFRPARRLLRFRRRHRIDFRNHRKIVVVDGHVGFTGGINVGREYLGLDPDRGEWRDTHMRIDGPATLSLQAAFAEDWIGATGELLDAARYFPEPQESGDSCVQIVDSGPDRQWSPIEHLYTQAFAVARRRIWLTTPYFVPSAGIEGGLVAAALRGIDVCLLVPARSDSVLVNLASRAYYPNLLRAGVRIHEFGHGFLHAKTMVVDDRIATIGSANLDSRSFHLNFELNAFVYSAPFANELATQFAKDLARARVVGAEEADPPLHRRALHAAARLTAPLL